MMGFSEVADRGLMDKGIIAESNPEEIFNKPNKSVQESFKKNIKRCKDGRGVRRHYLIKFIYQQ